MKVKITRDAKKLYSCPEFKRNHPDGNGRLPPVSGNEISIKLPGVPSHFCKSLIWEVIASAKIDRSKRAGMMVCEHQIDFLSPDDEILAKGKR